MSGINEQSIKEIENYVNKNQNILKNTIFEASYEDTAPFEFRPGDRTLLLSLPSSIRAYKETKKSTKRVFKLNPKQKNEAELKIELLKKLMNYSKSEKYDIHLKNEEILEFVKE